MFLLIELSGAGFLVMVTLVKLSILLHFCCFMLILEELSCCCCCCCLGGGWAAFLETLANLLYFCFLVSFLPTVGKLLLLFLTTAFV